MKLKSLSILLLTLITFSVSAEKYESIKLGYFQLPPFAYSDKTGAHKGIAIDYIKNIFKKRSINVSFKHYPFHRLLIELKKNRIDGAVLLGKNHERSKIFKYPKAPYISDRPGIVFRKGRSPKKLVTPKDLSGYLIGIPEKAYISPFIAKNKESLKLNGIPSGIEHLKPMMYSLSKSRGIDSLYLPTMSTLMSTGKELGISNKLTYLYTPEKAQNFYTVFKMNINKNILKSYNEENTNFISAKKLSEILK